jgi:hypothetical protein
MLRRLSLALALVTVTGLAVIGTAGAGPAASVSISWVMVGQGVTNPPSADIVLPSCGGVPAGMWVKGTGTWTLFAPTGGAGNIQSMANGSATDSSGNTYRWEYHQSIQPLPDGEHARVVDFFDLSGSGPAAGIHSHFIAIINATDIEEATDFVPLHLFGDPFNCDPI